ncbi:uncharacterized protein Ga0466249_000318 [Sporomusaceae bacterium BoRhaA]|uniref:thioether cross-link-forming SCIFF peptide maturase n=1 Tax=Pelorhabdus rhamnosifermentans TaxID=2772457 RepID=UPI001C061692|nr:thioether cross-link-forming SCIFF peptide maturase [Pelorhabdus rhamnosifermentans]MBU2699239.1 uncharacterized protein [Pelorhabdus rhamnosifermentans]
MHKGIHKFYLLGLYIVLDINSGLVHVVDKLVYDILDIFKGHNDQEVIEQLGSTYSVEALTEAMAELRELEQAEQLFTPEISAPMVFREKPVVKSLCLHVAHDCNLRCGYCFAGTGDFGHDRTLMSFEVGKKAVDYIIEHSGSRRHCEIDFFGGEPLMNLPVVKQIVTYVRQKEQETGKIFKLTLTTNAVLLDDETIDYLNDNNIALVLSLDGRQTTHDGMRPFPNGQGSFSTVQPKMAKFIFSRNNENYYVRGTYTAKNLDFANDVLAMADMGFKELSVEPVIEKEADYRLTEEHLPRIFAEYDKLTAAYLERKQSGNGFEFFHFNLDLNHGPCVAKRLSGCGAGHEYFAVSPQGELYPCHQFVGREEYKLGDVFTGVTNSELPIKFRETHVLNKEKCPDCWARFYCSGGCHANADLMNHDIKKPYELGCSLQKKRLECAIMVQAKRSLEKF